MFNEWQIKSQSVTQNLRVVLTPNPTDATFACSRLLLLYHIFR